MIAMKREKQNKTHAFIEIHAHPDDASSCFDTPAVDAANYQAAKTGAGQSLSQRERFNSERTDCGPVNQSKRRLVHPGSNATPYQLRFYENEYQYRSVLVRREACDADPALLGTKATITRRASSGRGRSLAA